MSYKHLPDEQLVPQVISEICDLESGIEAIGVVMLMKDGSIKFKQAIPPGHKLSMLAATDVFHAFMRAPLMPQPDHAPEPRPNPLGKPPSQ